VLGPTQMRTSRTKLGNVGLTLLSRLGVDTGYSKVFTLGMNKTGTSSIHRVMLDCGLVAMHNVRWRATRRAFLHWSCQGFADGPPDDFTRLDRRFPRSRFILNTRDLTEWMDSRITHITMERQRGKFRGGTWDLRPESFRAWVVQRDRIHRQVLEYFADRRDDLLVVNYIRDPLAHEKLARFLGAAHVPARANINPIPRLRSHGILQHRGVIETTLRDLEIPPSRWSNDLLCLDTAGTAVADTSQLGN
jgi:hypothetical protein